MEYSENFNFALPSRDNDIDLADINEIANNFRKIDEKAVKKEDIDQTYDPKSENPQSGVAVAEALANVEIDVDDEMSDTSTNLVQNKVIKEYVDDAVGTVKNDIDTDFYGKSVTEARRQTLLAIVNAIGLFNVENAQTLINNFNKAWDAVEPVPATSVILDKTNITFTTEDTQTIVATVLPTNTTDAVVWKSSDKSIATVKNGVITPLNDGKTVITATAGKVSATCSVTVNIYGEIENPVFLVAGYLTSADTATSNPAQHATYNRSVVFSAVPVKKGDTLTCKSSCTAPRTWYRFFIYDTDGANAKAIWSSEALGWDTVTATQDGYIRICIVGQPTGNDGLTNTVSEYYVTSNGEKTYYTVVDKR